MMRVGTMYASVREPPLSPFGNRSIRIIPLAQVCGGFLGIYIPLRWNMIIILSDRTWASVIVQAWSAVVYCHPTCMLNQQPVSQARFSMVSGIGSWVVGMTGGIVVCRYQGKGV